MGHQDEVVLKKRNSKYPQDVEGVEIRRGDLVYYSGEVWKVLGWRIDSTELPKYLNLKNSNGARNGVKDSNVECLGDDTITGMSTNGESKTPGNVHLPFKVGDHVCTRSHIQAFRTGKVVYADSAYVKIEVWEAGGCKTVKYRVDDVEHTGQQSASRAFEGGGNVIDINEREYDAYNWWERTGYGGSLSDKSLRRISSRSRKPSKRHSISTGELIEDEARRLREDGSPPKESGDDDDKPKIKKRKGEW